MGKAGTATKPSSTLLREVDEVRRRLEAMGNPKAAQMAREALRSPYPFYGVIPPSVRVLARQVARRHRNDPDLSVLFEMAGELWRGRHHEEKSVAIHMMATLTRRLTHDDWRAFKDWMADVHSADHCDGIAIDILGCLVKRDRTWCRVLRHWALSSNRWERRAAVGAVLLRARHMGDLDAALSVCEPLMRDPASAVQEAVAALLRECLSVDREGTLEFLRRWRGKAQPAILESLP